jgi:phosphate:Na+ symporter
MATAQALASGAPDWWQISISLAGGVSLFLFGMEQMTGSLRTLAGDGLKRLLAKLTTNRFMAALTGAVVTAVVQSSSVTTVLVVGFITAGVMSLAQSVGIIMGANIGTTITAQIVAFKVTHYALVPVAVGFLLQSFSRYDRMRQYGGMIMGLGLIFFGMYLMSEATAPLRDYPPFIELMARMGNPLLGILAGAAFTALVQSSSATTGVVIALASQGFISLDAGIALALGANIGTCVTAVIASIGKPPEAVRAAVVHVLFNVFGVVIWFALIPQLAELVRWLSPSATNLSPMEQLAAETPRQIANAHTIFNVANTLLLIWFVGPIAKLSMRLVPDRAAEGPERIAPKYLDEAFLDTPALALDRVRLELHRLGALVVQMLEAVPEAVFRGTPRKLDEIERMDDDVDHLQSGIVDYLRLLERDELAKPATDEAHRLLSATIYFENAGDIIETNLVSLGRERLNQKVDVSQATSEVIDGLYQSVAAALKTSLQAVAENDARLARRTIEMKARIEQQARASLDQIAERLLVDEPNRVAAFRIETDVVGQLKRLYYLAKRIAKTIAGEEDDGSEGAAAA